MLHRSSTVVLALLASVATLAAAPPVAAQETGPIRTALMPVNVGFLVLDGVYNSELVAPYDIFHHVRFHIEPGMRVFTVGREKGVVRTFEGLRIAVDHDLASAPPMDVLVVPSGEHSMGSDLEDERLVDWVRTRGRTARAVVSICDGAFVLAEAGLLDGRSCTTFPGDIPAFRTRYPHLNVVDGVRFVADGPAITGVGGARSYGPALYLVERLFGAAIARGVGRGMVIDWDLERVRHLDVPADPVACYMPGDRIDPAVTVENAAGDRLTLGEIIAADDDVRAVVLTIIAGAEGVPGRERDGWWCEDSFSEIPTLRHLRLKFGDRGVLFVGVLCPPVHHEAAFGYDDGAFLARPADDPVYELNRARFVAASLELERRGRVPFDVVVFDPRLRLLADARRGETTVGPRPPWQGRFKWHADPQTYGTPTTWILTPDLTVPSPPFFMNVYESAGRKLRFTARDMEILLERLLAER